MPLAWLVAVGGAACGTWSAGQSPEWAGVGPRPTVEQSTPDGQFGSDLLAPPSTGEAAAASSEDSAPAGLALPFAVTDLDDRGGHFEPFGVVRWSLDRSEFGHSGIDLPLRQGAEIYAVADGRIAAVNQTVDHRPGSIVTLLLGDGTLGEGWGFIYEHVMLEEELRVGSRVERGARITSNPLDPLSANNHFQLSYLFNDYTFFRSHACWVDQLDLGSWAALLDRFAGIRSLRSFLQGWRTVEQEGARPFRGLFDSAAFPDGPQLCYPPGTDVRSAP